MSDIRVHTIYTPYYNIYVFMLKPAAVASCVHLDPSGPQAAQEGRSEVAGLCQA